MELRNKENRLQKNEKGAKREREREKRNEDRESGEKRGGEQKQISSPFGVVVVSMLHSSPATPSRRKGERVLNLSFKAEPQPNRALGSGNAGSSPARSSSPSPSPSSHHAVAQRPSATQSAICQRKLQTFMRSILIKRIPCWQPNSETSTSAFDSQLASSSLYPRIIPIPGLFEKIKPYLEHDNQDESASADFDTLRICSSFSDATATSRLPSTKSSFETALHHPHARSGIVMDLRGDAVETAEHFIDATDRFDLPYEILSLIIDNMEVNRDLLALSATCKGMRRIAMAESRWNPLFQGIGRECGYPTDALERDGTYPSYLRYFSILRWKEGYLRLKGLLEGNVNVLPGGPTIMEQIESEWCKMMPDVSPWQASNSVTEEIVMTLPPLMEISPFQNSDTAVLVHLELDSGAHKHELLRQGLPPVLEFVIYEPAGDHPKVTCRTPGLYHPLLSSSGHLGLPLEAHSLRRSAGASSATIIRELLLLIKDAFTNISSIAADLTC